jgi:uncharacterized coiled-coil protein SlyX
MNPKILLNTAAPSRLLVALVLICFALAPLAWAVVPPADGGYPNFTTAEGQNALQNLTTGAGNTAVGWLSLRTVTNASFNTAIGAGTLALNTADENTATGAGALLSNTTGTENTANGAFALFGNTEGSFDTAVGDRALFSNTTGIVNTAIGAGALASNTTGDHNTAIGGDFVLFSNTTGSLNTATGVSALAANTTGNGNTAIGADALPENITGTGNTAVGAFALSNTTGGENTAIGDEALVNNTTGGGNTVLGAFAGSGITTANNVICIGAQVAGNNVDNSCYIGQIFGATSSGGTGVFINTNGRLGTMTSSRRFKEEIKPMDKASEALLGLKPVTFHYKKDIDPVGTPQFGLVAEEVEKVNPDLVVRDKEGKPYSVRYDQVNAMLLNEFLKEHKKVEEQQVTIAELKSTVAQQKGFEYTLAKQEKQIEALTAGLQKVSAQLESNKPAPQVVNNP